MYLPNYDLDGKQNLLRPYKNKDVYQNVEPLWQGKPAHQTRSELLATRRAAKLSDPSFDLDDDGVVGAKDHFLASRFDKDRDGKLSESERKECMEALHGGFAKKYYWLDASGDSKGFEAYQQRGVVYTGDEVTRLTDNYPPHPISTNKPAHNTRTELMEHRKGIIKNEADSTAKIAESRRPWQTEERARPLSDFVADPPIRHISERADADHQALRVASGLLPLPAPLNPHRELKTIGVDYVSDPLVKSRKQLLAVRKLDLAESLEDQRMRGDERLPKEVLKAAKDNAAFELRAPKNPPVTLSSVKHARKCEFIEYNMRNFKSAEAAVIDKATKKPWWEDVQGSPATSPTMERTAGRSSLQSDVAFKVNHVVPCPMAPTNARSDKREAAGVSSDPLIAPVEPVHASEANFHESKKRWTTQVLERGTAAQGQRLFDSLKQPQTLIQDFKPLSEFSSFEVIRSGAQNDMEKARARNRIVPTVSKQSYATGLDPAHIKSGVKLPQEPRATGKTIPDRVISSGFQN